MTFTLIIKGDMGDALAALKRYDITPITISRHPRLSECGVTAAATTSWETLAQWFCAKNRLPFPPGTLLWYGPTYEPPKE